MRICLHSSFFHNYFAYTKYLKQNLVLKACLFSDSPHIFVRLVAQGSFRKVSRRRLRYTPPVNCIFVLIFSQKNQGHCEQGFIMFLLQRFFRRMVYLPWRVVVAAKEPWGSEHCESSKRCRVWIIDESIKPFP